MARFEKLFVLAGADARSPDRMRKARQARHLARYFCATPSIPMVRKLAYLSPTSA